MEKFNITLAEKTIEINPLYSYIKDYCKDYIIANGSELRKSDLTIYICEDDIVYERKKSKAEAVKNNTPLRNFSNEYLETLAVYRKIAEGMLDYDTLLFHGSVVAVDGEGYLFTAKSGTGKSTHTRLWRKYFGNKAVMINDDKPLLKITKNGVIAYGTPWNGKHKLGENSSALLKAICVLERDLTNHITSVEKSEIYPMLIQQVYRPKDAVKLLKTMELVDVMAKNVKLYKLGCNMESNAVLTAYNGMK